MSIYIIAFIILAAAIGGWLTYDTYKNKQEAKRTAERRAMRKAKHEDDRRRREERKKRKQQPLEKVTNEAVESVDNDFYSSEESENTSTTQKNNENFELPSMPVEQAARDIQLEEVRQETKNEDIIPLDLIALEQARQQNINPEIPEETPIVEENLKSETVVEAVEEAPLTVEETPEQQAATRSKIRHELDSLTERVNPILGNDFNFDTTFNDTMFSDFLNDPNNDVKNPTFTSNTGGNRKTPTILFVDDAKTFRIKMENIIKQGGKQVLLAANGQEAYDVLTKGTKPVDMVISDVEMPMVDGYELFRKIQENGKFEKLPFVIVTASNDNAIKAKELGVTEVLLKPFNDNDIDKLIRRLLPQFY